MQDDARVRLLSCKYQKAMLEGAKAISEFDDLNESEIHGSGSFAQDVGEAYDDFDVNEMFPD